MTVDIPTVSKVPPCLWLDSTSKNGIDFTLPNHELGKSLIKWKEYKSTPRAPRFPGRGLELTCPSVQLSLSLTGTGAANGRATELCLLKSGSPDWPTWKASAFHENLDSRTPPHFPLGLWNLGLKLQALSDLPFHSFYKTQLTAFPVRSHSLEFCRLVHSPWEPGWPGGPLLSGRSQGPEGSSLAEWVPATLWVVKWTSAKWV